LIYTVLPLEEATKRFALDDFLFADDRKNKNKVVKIAEYDAELAELCLDMLPDDNTVAYIFVGNLTVSGAIWNEVTDFGITLIALKNVIAKNIAVGGQEVCIDGNLIVEGLLCGSYNHGTMTVKGDVKAKYILNDGDYTFLFGHAVEAIVLNDIKSGYYKINNWKESLDNFAFVDASNIEYWDVLNPLVYDVYNDSFDFTELIKILNSGGELFINNNQKLKELNFNPNYLCDLFADLDLKKVITHFGFGLKSIDLSFDFNKYLDNYSLEIKLRNESFKYVFNNERLRINQLTINSLPKELTAENDVKNYYRAVSILIKTKEKINDFIAKRNKIFRSTRNIFAHLFPKEFSIIYPSLIMLYVNPIEYYNANKTLFDELKIDYLDWSFQKQALLYLLKQSDIALVINGKEYISTALNDLENWFKKRDFDIETDWKARGLYLKRRIEYFSKDVLIVNEICKEKNIPLSILDFSLWLNDRFIVFFPVKNEEKELFLEWLNDSELTK
jgi:hypothetical protein